MLVFGTADAQNHSTTNTTLTWTETDKQMDELKEVQMNGWVD